MSPLSNTEVNSNGWFSRGIKWLIRNISVTVGEFVATGCGQSKKKAKHSAAK